MRLIQPTEESRVDAMKQSDLINLAKKYFIFDPGLSKANLVRKIQREQGHIDCFATGKTECDQLDCWWRQDCLQGSPKDAPTDVSNLVKTRNDPE